MTPDPAITVLMTVFNGGRFLDPSIRSIVGQTFRNFEFLIIDDASTDGSPALLREWAARDPRIRLVLNEANQGQTACLNQGLRLARGKWIARQDADDLSHLGRLGEQYQYLTMHPEVALLGTSGRIIDDQDRLIGLLDLPLTPFVIAWSSAFLNPFLHTAVLFRADVARDELHGYDERYRIAQDYDLWMRIIATYRSANLPQRLVCYRHLGASLSKAGRGRAFDEASQVAHRQARSIFRRPLNENELRLVGSFREGLDPARRRAFWHLYCELLPPSPSGRLEKLDLARTQAAHHLKAAGSVASRDPLGLAAELAAAFRLSPSFTTRWLRERYFNS